MNTEQVVEMIDAITEGREYELKPNVAENADTLEIGFWDEEVILRTKNQSVSLTSAIDNPHVAREIAGALVAWANRKEAGSKSYGSKEPGNPHPGTFHGGQICPTCRKAREPEISTADAIKIMSGRMTRSEWYAENVGRMSVEEARENLIELENHVRTMTNDHKINDALKAINILRAKIEANSV